LRFPKNRIFLQNGLDNIFENQKILPDGQITLAIRLRKIAPSKTNGRQMAKFLDLEGVEKAAALSYPADNGYGDPTLKKYLLAEAYLLPDGRD
jgi:hypothetical protein